MMSCSQTLLASFVRIGLVLGICSIAPVTAAADALPRYLSTVGYALSSDDSGAVSHNLDAEFGMSPSFGLRAGVGKTFAGDTEDFPDTTNWSIGARGDVAPDWQLSGGFRHWGSNDNVITNTWNLALSGWLSEQWRLRVLGEHNDISFSTTRTRILRRTIPSEVTAQNWGWGAGVSFLPTAEWYVGAEAETFSYDKDVDRFDAAPRLVQAVFSPLAQSSINSLQKRRYSVDGGYTFSAGLIGLRWDRGISAVDNHSYDTYTALVDWDFAPRWTVSIDVGLADNYESDKTAFAGAGVRWQF